MMIKEHFCFRVIENKLYDMLGKYESFEKTEHFAEDAFFDERNEIANMLDMLRIVCKNCERYDEDIKRIMKNYPILKNG